MILTPTVAPHCPRREASGALRATDVPLIGRPGRDATLSKSSVYDIGRSAACGHWQMPKPPGVAKCLPVWQKEGRKAKTGCWKIFLDFQNFLD